MRSRFLMHTARTVLIAPILVAAGGYAEPDMPGSTDPGGIARFPGAWIIAYSPETGHRSYEFITGAVARIRREVRIERSVRADANLVRVTYRTPSDTRLDDAIAHYERVVEDLGGRVEFACRGQDCGHGTIWANQIFGVRELAAPDTAQFYLAATLDGPAVESAPGTSAMVSIYVVQRPNRRVNVHVDFAVSEESEPAGGDVAKALDLQGFVVIEGAAPDAVGNLDASDLQVLDALAPVLAAYAGRIAVVCHLGSSADTARSLVLAEACARAASERLDAGGVEAAAFGAGSFVPREGAPPDRLELVIPGATNSR